MKKLHNLLKILIKCKFVLFLPKKSDVVIWGAPRFIKVLIDKQFIPKKKISLIHIWGESINLSILLKCILKLRLNILDYSEEYLRYTKPKIIISFLDNYEIFYKLKSEKKQKKILIQNAYRTGERKFFEKKDFILKSNLDYILTQNYPIIKKYQSICKADIRPIGSFLSNNSKCKYNKKRFDILYVSTFRNTKKYNRIIDKKISLNDYINAEARLIKNIYEYCKKKKIKFSILPTNPNKDQEIEEKIFFNKLLGKEKNWRLLLRKADDFNYAYDIIDQSKVVVGIDSTLLYESFARGTKTIFFDIRPNNNFLKKRRHFGWPKKFNQEGPFWSSINKPYKVHKLIDKVNLMDNRIWKKIKLKYEKDLMVTDKKNSILKKIIKKYLK